MFNRYQGKAIERLAHEVLATDVIVKTKAEATSAIDIDGELVYFKHYDPVMAGDFIVYVNDEDIYHCGRKVFLDRNHIEGVDLDFGTAIKIMKAGGKVARAGWNGADMFAYYVESDTYPAQNNQIKGRFVNDMVPYRAYLALKTAQDDVATWSPSTSDCLANDWFIVE